MIVDAPSGYVVNEIVPSMFAEIGGVVARELRIKPAATTQPCSRVDPYARANEAAH